MVLTLWPRLRAYGGMVSGSRRRREPTDSSGHRVCDESVLVEMVLLAPVGEDEREESPGWRMGSESTDADLRRCCKGEPADEERIVNDGFRVKMGDEVVKEVGSWGEKVTDGKRGLEDAFRSSSWPGI